MDWLQEGVGESGQVMEAWTKAGAEGRGDKPKRLGGLWAAVARSPAQREHQEEDKMLSEARESRALQQGAGPPGFRTAAPSQPVWGWKWGRGAAGRQQLQAHLNSLSPHRACAPDLLPGTEPTGLWTPSHGPRSPIASQRQGFVSVACESSCRWDLVFFFSSSVFRRNAIEPY